MNRHLCLTNVSTLITAGVLVELKNLIRFKKLQNHWNNIKRMQM